MNTLRLSRGRQEEEEEEEKSRTRMRITHVYPCEMMPCAYVLRITLICRLIISGGYKNVHRSNWLSFKNGFQWRFSLTYIYWLTAWLH